MGKTLLISLNCFFKGVYMKADYKYDICISFAGKDRKIANEIAIKLKEKNVKVFYDDFEKSRLWGENLIETFMTIYKDDSEFCLMLVSKDYKESLWTTHERKSAQARAFHEKSSYILPLRLDNTDLEGLLPTVGYIDFNKENVDDIIDFIIEKIWGNLKNDMCIQKLLPSIESVYNRTMLVAELIMAPPKLRGHDDIKQAEHFFKDLKKMLDELCSQITILNPKVSQLGQINLNDIITSYKKIFRNIDFLQQYLNPKYINSIFVIDIPENEFHVIHDFLDKMNVFDNYGSTKKYYTPNYIVNRWKAASATDKRFCCDPNKLKRKSESNVIVRDLSVLQKIKGSKDSESFYVYDTKNV